jgi:ABC-2 type transport system ATP-binding protein
MDEAERCDQIAYLAHGELITQGRVKDVIALANLVTFKATGVDIRRYAQWLKSQVGVDNAAYFGSALHVSGQDRVLLQQAIHHSHCSGLNWQEIPPSLEDVFISLMNRAGHDKRDFS